MSAWNIAVIGATGAVGSAIIELLEERQFPVSTLFTFASEQSHSENIRFAGKTVNIKSLADTDFDWSDINIAFFAANSLVSQEYAAAAADMGCIVIDLSGAFTDSADIPLIVPGLNDHHLSDYRNNNIIAVANGIVCQLLKSLQAITDLENITQLHVSNYLPASFYGKSSLDSLASQSVRLLNGLSIEERQLAFNLQPVIPSSHLLPQDAELVLQCRRVLGNYQLPVSFDCIDVPVFYGLSQSINVMTQYPVDLEQLSIRMTDKPNIELYSLQQAPTPVSQQDASSNLRIGHVRYAYGLPELLQYWTVSDNVRYLGALMAIEIAERLVEDLVGY